MCMCAHAWLPRGQKREGTGSLGPGVTGGCEMFAVGVGDPAWVFCEGTGHY